MPDIPITATFPDHERAESAIAALEQDGIPRSNVDLLTDADLADLGKRETRFMGRIVLIVAGWSVIGTAIGAALRAFFSYTIGPHGTSGLILQVVTWAIFAHLLIGMWAGYLLLADRTARDLPAARAATAVLVLTTPEDADLIATRLRQLGATSVDVPSSAATR